MTAGVHSLQPRRPLQPSRLPDRKGIELRTDPYRGPLATEADEVAALDGFGVRGLKSVEDDFGCLALVSAELWVRV